MIRFIHRGCKYLPFIGVLLVGCERISPEDRAFFEERDRERSQRETLLRAASASVKSDDIVQHVRQSPAPDGEGTIDDWLSTQTLRFKGQIMFPRWTTSSRGSNKQEVMYEFVLIDAQNQMRKLHYIWDVDVLDMTVGPPRIAQLEQIDSPDRAIAQKNLRRVLDHEKQLD